MGGNPNLHAPPLVEERQNLEQLVRSIAVAQGNRFIKDLLRTRGIRIGRTKADFEENMLAAIDSGDLNRGHLDEWLRDVEGWGDQHIYLYSVPPDIYRRPVWRNAEETARLVREAGFDGLWNAPSTLEFAPVRTLVGIFGSPNRFQMIWHQGTGEWTRKEERDFERDEEDGDRYWYKAFRQSFDRILTRFEFRPTERVAALFLRTPFERQIHVDEIAELSGTINRVFDLHRCSLMAVGTVIKRMDDLALEQVNRANGVQSQSSRLESGGASVEFTARSVGVGYHRSGPVRDLRRAMQVRQFSGNRGTFYVPVTAHRRSRPIKVELHGVEKRIRLKFKMTSDEVWALLLFLRDSL